MTKSMLSITLLVLSLLAEPASGGPLTFTPGHIYTTASFGRDVNEYTPDGQLVDTLDLTSLAPGEATKGIGFGSDHRLYVVADSLFQSSRLLAIDPTGNILSSYQLPASTGGNLSLGKLGFGPGGLVYVGTGFGLLRVNTNQDTVQNIYGPEVFDVERLPSGHLVVAEAYRVLELDADGALVREIVLTDPDHISGATSFSYNDLGGLEYDPQRDRLLVSMLGSSGGSGDLLFKTMAFDFASGALKYIRTFNYGDDMYLGHDGVLLLGSRTQPPWILATPDLAILDQLDGRERMFVTRFEPVPGPRALLALALGLGVMRLLGAPAGRGGARRGRRPAAGPWRLP